MKKTQIALKPYLDKITAHCSALSNKELTDVIISLAKDVPTSDIQHPTSKDCTPSVFQFYNLMEHFGPST